MSDAEQPQRTPLPENLSSMNDPDFLDWCQRIREAIEEATDEIPPELLVEFELCNREYLRRAGLALNWRVAV